MRFIRLSKIEGAGEMIVPVSEIGIASTFVYNVGTEDEPDWKLDPERCLVHIRCIDENIVVDQSIDALWNLLPDE